MGKSGKGIPDNWEDYASISKQIPGTRFIAFKVPLKDALLNNLDVTVEFFDVNTLVEQCPNLGLVIDLTNTDRYYDPTEFHEHNVSFYKLKTFGHVIPTDHIVFKFFEVVEGFLSNNKNNDKLIGVHCTHGVNRTGYMIIRYMIQQLNMKPGQAISAFNAARGHALEKENYLVDLNKSMWPKPPKFIPRRRTIYRTFPQQEAVYKEPIFDDGCMLNDGSMMDAGPMRRQDFTTRGPIMKEGPLMSIMPLLSGRLAMRDFKEASPLVPYEEKEIPPPRPVPVWDIPRPFPVPLLPRTGDSRSRQDYYEDKFEGPSFNRLIRPLIDSNLDESNDYHNLHERRPLLEPQSSFSIQDRRRFATKNDCSFPMQERRTLDSEPNGIFLSRESRNISEPTSHLHAIERRARPEPIIRPLMEDPLPLPAFRRPTGEAPRLGKPYYKQIEESRGQFDSYTLRGDDREFRSLHTQSRSLSSLLHDDIPPRHFRDSEPNTCQPLLDELDLMHMRRAPQKFDSLMRERSLSLFESERSSALGPRPLPFESQRNAYSLGARNDYSSSDNDFPARMRSGRFLPY